MRRATQRAIAAEQKRQLKLWGEQRHDRRYWMTILVEEVGEIAKELNEIQNCGIRIRRFANKMSEETLLNYCARIIEADMRMKKELTEVAAIAATWLDAIDKANAAIPDNL